MLFRLTENVFIQNNKGPQESQVNWDALRGPSSADPDIISHVIHFYRGKEADQRTQEATVKSVLEARRCAVSKVQLFSVVLEEDRDLLFEGFSPTAPLTRTISDIAKFEIPRRLPLLFDTIDAGAERSDPNGYIVFTNCDICLQSGFYNSVRALLRYGADCLIINRLTAGQLDSFGEVPELGRMEVGEKHYGYDCFVFPVSWVKSFVKANSCVGMPAVMRPLLYNLVARAQRMLMMKSACLTYHYGDEMPWKAPQFADYRSHNASMIAESLTNLSRDRVAFQRLSEFCAAHNEPLVPQRRT